MKTLLLGGNKGFWHAGDRAGERDIFSGIEAWVYAFDGDHCNSLDATPELVRQYDLIIGNTNGNEYRPKLLSLQESRKKDTKWVTLIEGCATDYLTLNPTLKKILDGSDLVNVINRHTLDFFRACTTARCEYIGIPYPADTIRKRFPHGHGRDVWTASNLFSTRSSQASILAAMPVTNNAGTHLHRVYRNKISKRLWPKLLDRRAKQGSDTEPMNAELIGSTIFHPLTDFATYFQTLSQTAFAFVNLDHRYTWARDVLDCAALQIPCIATRSTGHAADFFPGLMVENEFSVREAGELLSRLYSDPEFYRESSLVPIELFEPLSPRNMKQKLLNALH